MPFPLQELSLLCVCVSLSFLSFFNLEFPVVLHPSLLLLSYYAILFYSLHLFLTQSLNFVCSALQKNLTFFPFPFLSLVSEHTSVSILITLSILLFFVLLLFPLISHSAISSCWYIKISYTQILIFSSIIIFL